MLILLTDVEREIYECLIKGGLTQTAVLVHMFQKYESEIVGSDNTDSEEEETEEDIEEMRKFANSL